jgi:hypothetical protein
MMFRLVRGAAAVLSFAALTLGSAGSSAQAQCKGGQAGSQNSGPGGGQMSQRTPGGSQQSRAGGAQQGTMQQIAAIQQQQLTMMQSARGQQQAALQAALQTTMARIEALRDEADESPRAATRLAWLQERQAVLQSALDQTSNSMTVGQRGQR